MKSLCYVTLAAIVAVFLLAVAPSLAADRPLVFGIGPCWAEWTGNDPATFDPAMFDRIKNAGATGFRTGLDWCNIEDTPGAYTWTEYDRRVQLGLDRGLEVQGLICTTPGWANDTGVDDIYRPKETSQDYFVNFCAEAARHYKDKIKYWEFWNEEDSGGWKPQTNAAEYTRWLKRAYIGLKAGNPNCVVSLGGVLNSDLGFLTSVYDNGGGSYFDAFSIHPYATPDVQYTMIQNARQIMVNHGDSAKPMWVGEYGWNLMSGVTQAEQAQYLLNVLDTLRGSTYDYITFMTYLVVRDFDIYRTVKWGLCDIDLTPRPAYTNFQNYNKQYGTISGYVRDGSGGAIQGATVKTWPCGYTATTNASGLYTISNVAAGTSFWNVTASKSGFGTVVQANKTVSSGQTCSVDFTLQTPGTISGNVKDNHNNNISGANVYTSINGYDSTTDVNGNYTISGVAPATYTVYAAKNGYATGSQSNVTVTSSGTQTVNYNLTQNAFTGISNGNFEGGFYNENDPDHRTGKGWCKFVTAGSPKHGEWSARYHSAAYSQALWEGSWTGGFWQRVENCILGNNYTATVWVAAYTDSGGATGSGDGRFWIGIDPTGGMDPAAGTVQWSSQQVSSGTFVQISKQVTASSTKLTVFLKAQNTNATSRYVALDDATLTDNGASTVGTISGTVKDNLNNNLSGATVSTTTGGYTTTSNSAGAFTLSNVATGTYSVVASKAGYQSQTNAGVVVNQNQTTTTNFNLTPVTGTGTIAGNVKDGSNNNLSGAVITTNTGGYSATSDANGNYTIASVTPGTYNVTASKSGYQSQTQSNQTVTQNQTTTVNFSLPVQGGSFSGITNGLFESGFHNDPDTDHQTANNWTKFVSAGTPKHGSMPTSYHSPVASQDFYEGGWTAGLYQVCTGATVGNLYTARFWCAGFSDSSCSVGSSDLKFWVGIDPAGGTNPASANVQWSAQAAPSGTWTEISKQVTASSSSITVFLKAQNINAGNRYALLDDASATDDGGGGGGTGVISGWVKDNLNNAISGATVTTNTGGYSATTDASGNYTLSSVAAGTYNVTASKSGWTSVTASNQVVTSGATTTCNINLQLGTISGWVKDNQSVAISGATVTTNTGGYSATTDASGNYTISNVQPGTYNVTGSKSGWTSVTNSNVSVTGGQTATSNITLQRGTITGNVKDTSSNNLSGATVTTTTGGYSATTDASGNFTMSNVLPGTYNLTASKSGYQNQTVSNKTVTGGQTTSGVQFNLAPTGGTGAISGNVKNKDNINISGATVSTTTGGYITTTDASGNYTLSSVAPATYSVVAAKSGFTGQTNAGVVVTAGNTTTSNFTQLYIAQQDFTSVPTWSSTYNATWGSAASFTAAGGGQSGNCLQATRTSQGSSPRVLWLAVPTNTTITVSGYMKCPSYTGGTYWMEFAYKFGQATAQNFDNNGATWTMIQKFANSGFPNGNGNTWTKYSLGSIATGANTQISIGYKDGAQSCNGPTMQWDTLLID